MQLTPCPGGRPAPRRRPRLGDLPAGCGLVAIMLASPLAHAQANAAARITVFSEHSNSNDGLQVLHPQGDVSGTIAETAVISAGYSLDAVSGATPAVFGPRTGPDAITGATRFDDTRHDAHGGLSFIVGPLTFGGGYAYAWESDYKSHAVSGTATGDLIDKNFTLDLAWAHNFDTVCDAANQNPQNPLDLRPLTDSAPCFTDSAATTTRKLAVDTIEPSLSWVATPRFLLQFGASAQILDGFQSNPYRSVLVGSQHGTPQEHIPSHRQRFALFLRGVHALPARSAVVAGVRGYRDTWAVDDVTGDLELRKYLLTSVLIQAHGRYHKQRGAIFYRTGADYRNLGPVGEYWTGDRELSPMSSFLGGARLAYVRKPGQQKFFFERLEVTLRIDYILYFVPDDAPSADRDYALVGQFGLSAGF